MKDFINKSIRLALFTVLTVGVLANCEKKKEDNTLLLAALFLSQSGIAGSSLCDGVGVPAPTQTLEGTITTAVTVSGSALLKGTVNVTNGGSLTVEPGSVIFGDIGSSLFIYEGGTLTAVGTASRPICFSSSQAVGGRAPGNWGGIVAIGNGLVTATGNTEGTTPRSYPATVNSNINLRYVVIEFAGNEVAPGNELNGLSSYAVTTSTSSYDYVQIHRGLDDGFEWWGGDVNGTHLLVTGGQDDDFDIDDGFQGTLRHLIGVKYPTSCGGTASTDPHGFEMDGSAGGGVAPTSAGTFSNPIIDKFTTIGQNVAAGVGMRSKESMKGRFSDGLVYGYVSENFNFTNNSGTTAPTTWTNIKGQSGKGATVLAPAVNNTEITSLPIASLGNIPDCGVGENLPDFTTTFGDGSLGGGSIAEGKWWSGGWTVYRSK